MIKLHRGLDGIVHLITAVSQDGEREVNIPIRSVDIERDGTVCIRIFPSQVLIRDCRA